MYQEKIDKILLVNNYLTKCKMQNPNSAISRVAQKYLTMQINQILNENEQKIYNFLNLF